MSDEMAVCVVAAARARVARARRRVGGRLRRHVTAGTSDPPLTTVHQPHAAKGAAAVRMLLAGGDGPQEITFPVELVVRASTAPPPGAG